MKLEKFQSINLSKEVIDAVSDMGFEELSPIQAQAIPYLMEGLDVIGQAQTGTGKTAAFGIPIVEKVNPNDKSIQAMVLCPTRELCIQVSKEITKLAKYKRDVMVLPIYGGQPIERQIRGLKKGVQIVVGTPGRVIDHINRRTLKTGNIQMFVLDEADEMFDMGFRDDIELVLKDVPQERQSLFFSATMSREIMDFAKRYQKNPEVVKVVNKELTVPKVNQFYFDLKSGVKTEVLARVLDIYDPKLTVVFCNTKKKVDELTGELQGRGYFADGLHGDLKQVQRDIVMDKFRKGNIEVLVATDVAARGIDVDDVDLVVNYDMPQDNEYYVHRIGRTARAGRKGTAISFVTNRDFNTLMGIQRYTKTDIERRPLPTLKDIRERQSSRIVDELRRIIEEEDLTRQLEVVEVLETEDIAIKEIAAAAIKLFNQENKSDEYTEIDGVDNNKNKGKDRNRNRNDRNPRDARDGQKRSKRVSNSSRLYIDIGRKSGVTPRHILSALCNDAGLTSKEVGQIEIYDKFTFVEVESKAADQAIKKLDNKHIKGNKVSVERSKNPRR
ncbi:MAG: DEAD/DEAH box helicase [Tissierellia bacterium]|nr:DEAD/DEAH box helicase [Tissierellia bacterium]